MSNWLENTELGVRILHKYQWMNIYHRNKHFWFVNDILNRYRMHYDENIAEKQALPSPIWPVIVKRDEFGFDIDLRINDICLIYDRNAPLRGIYRGSYLDQDGNWFAVVSTNFNSEIIELWHPSKVAKEQLSYRV